MQDSFEKYLRLSGYMILSALAGLAIFVLLLLSGKAVFGLLNYMPWMVFVYKSGMLLIPAAIFIPAYLIFFRRTARHPAGWVRIISRFLFAMALLGWLYALINDLMVFLAKPAMTVESYLSFDLFFLSGNVACLFLIGILQALTTAKETDWMERPH